MILNSNRPWKPAARDRYLTVVEGHLWMTGSRGGEDYVLGPGQTLALHGKGWLAQALGHRACEFVTSETAPAGHGLKKRGAGPTLDPCPGPATPTEAY